MKRASGNGNGQPRGVDVLRQAWRAVEATFMANDAHISGDEELLACWSAGLLTEREQQQWEEHLSVCGRCRKEVIRLVSSGAVRPPESSPASHSVLPSAVAIALAVTAACVLLVFRTPWATIDEPRLANGLQEARQMLSSDPSGSYDAARLLLEQEPDAGTSILTRQLLEQAAYQVARGYLAEGDFDGVNRIWTEATRHGAGSGRLANLRIQAQRRQRAEILLAQAGTLLDYGFELDGTSPIQSRPVFDESARQLRLDYVRAVAEFPGDAALRLNFGQFLLAGGEAGEAREQFQAAYEAGDHAVQTQLGTGLAALAEQDFEPALRHFQSVLEADSANVAAHLNVAATLTQLGRHVEAQRHWQHAARFVQDELLKQRIQQQLETSKAETIRQTVT
jgi:tetratricopeptide (TPR) repeat protein